MRQRSEEDQLLMISRVGRHRILFSLIVHLKFVFIQTDTAIESLAERVCLLILGRRAELTKRIKHAASLASLVPTMERYLRSELDMVLSLGREQFQGMLDIAVSIQVVTTHICASY